MTNGERFPALDALRGVAALYVMAYHRAHWFGGPDALGRGYLAVDFFFMLSGFVLAHAYAGRLDTSASRRAFLRDRLIRLHPMLVMGAALGCLVTIAQVRAGTIAMPRHPLLTGLFGFIPLPVLWGVTGDAFPVNFPEWSLFWELCVNLAFALIASRLTAARLFLVIAAAGLAVATSLLTPNGFGTGREIGDLWGGIPKVALSFFIGVALSRVHRRGWRVFVPGGSWLPAMLLIASFALLARPRSGLSPYDLAIVLLIYPFILLWAAGASPRWPAVATWLGAVSYPLYLLHNPVLQLLNRLRQLVVPGAPKEPTPLAAVAMLAVVPIVAWLALKLYDEPVRTALRRRFGSPRHRAPDVEASAPVDAGRG